MCCKYDRLPFLPQLVKRFHDWKNSETGVMDAMMTDMMYTDEYPGKQSAYLGKYLKAKALQKSWEDEGEEAVMDMLRSTRRKMVQPKWVSLSLFQLTACLKVHS